MRCLGALGRRLRAAAHALADKASDSSPMNDSPRLVPSEGGPPRAKNTAALDSSACDRAPQPRGRARAGDERCDELRGDALDATPASSYNMGDHFRTAGRAGAVTACLRPPPFVPSSWPSGSTPRSSSQPT